MKRLLGALAIVATLLCLAPTAHASDCLESDFEDGCVTDATDAASSDGVDGFMVLFVLVLIVGIGLTIYKMSMASNMAKRSGMDPGEAAAMTLLDDSGLSATYLASNLRKDGPEPRIEVKSAETRLEELKRVLDEGLITRAEYDVRRQAIIDSI